MTDGRSFQKQEQSFHPCDDPTCGCRSVQLPVRLSVLDEAGRLTSSDRQKAYGHPRLHFSCTAAMVTAYLHRRGLLVPGAALDANDWAMLMVLDKTSRYTGQRKRDCLVDIAGYARTAEMLEEEP